MERLRLIGASAHAETYYCKLANVPQVITALNTALNAVDTAKLDVHTTGEIKQSTLQGKGDAFDFYGTDLLIYQLDGLAKDNVLAVAVKVKYSSVMAEELKRSEPENPDIVCKDTHEVNAAIVYFDGENDQAIQAGAYSFN